MESLLSFAVSEVVTKVAFVNVSLVIDESTVAMKLVWVITILVRRVGAIQAGKIGFVVLKRIVKQLALVDLVDGQQFATKD